MNTKSVSKTTKSTEKSIPKSVPRTTKSTENSSKKSNHMDEKDLEKLSKSELIKMLLKLQTKQRPKIIIVNDYKQVPKPHKSVKNIVKNYEDNIIPPPIQFRDDYKPVPLPRTKKQVPTEKPIPAPRKSVKEMVQKLEDNIILPPMKFRDKPIPLPRTKKQAPIEKPVPLPRTKITLLNKALKGFNKSFEISIKNYKDPLEQLQKTRKGIESNIKNELASMKGIKFIETLKITFEKQTGDDDYVDKIAYFNSTAQTIINHTEIDEALQLSKQQILNKVAQWVSDGSGWLVESVDNHYINIVKYQPMKGSSYIKLPTELQNSSKGLIKIKIRIMNALDGVILDI